MLEARKRIPHRKSVEMAKRPKRKTRPSRLGDLLVSHGLITRDQRREALQRQKQTERRLGEILVEQGTLTRDELNWALGNLLGVPYVELEASMVDPELTRSVPADLLRRYQAVPMIQVGNELTLAMADPTDSQAIADIGAVTGTDVKVAMADPEAVADTLAELAPEKPQAAEPRIEIRRSAKKRSPTPEQLLADPSGALLLQHHLRQAHKQGADEILFQPSADAFRVRYRVHGSLADCGTYPTSFLPNVVTRLKLTAGLDLEGDILFQEGQVALDLEGRALELFASVYATVHGPGARIQLRAKRAEPWPLSKLGYEKSAQASLRRAAAAPAGLVAVCGPRRSGCSTTLYALLRQAASESRRTVTIESATSYRYADATQIEVGPGPDYHAVVGRIAEQAPDVVLAEGLHDREFWAAVGPQALTSTLLLGEMRAEDTLAALSQLRENGIGASVLAASLRLVVAQRLAPRLDPHARETDTPSSHVLDRLTAVVPDAGAAQYYRAMADADGHKVFRGLELIYELLEPTDEIRDLILDGAPTARLREACDHAGMTTLRECAIGKAARGLIELEEAL